MFELANLIIKVINSYSTVMLILDADSFVGCSMSCHAS